jgi:hypothetical protein
MAISGSNPLQTLPGNPEQTILGPGTGYEQPGASMGAVTSVEVPAGFRVVANGDAGEAIPSVQDLYPEPDIAGRGPLAPEDLDAPHRYFWGPRQRNLLAGLAEGNLTDAQLHYFMVHGVDPAPLAPAAADVREAGEVALEVLSARAARSLHEEKAAAVRTPEERSIAAQVAEFKRSGRTVSDEQLARLRYGVEHAAEAAGQAEGAKFMEMTPKERETALKTQEAEIEQRLWNELVAAQIRELEAHLRDSDLALGVEGLRRAIRRERTILSLHPQVMNYSPPPLVAAYTPPAEKLNADLDTLEALLAAHEQRVMEEVYPPVVWRVLRHAHDLEEGRYDTVPGSAAAPPPPVTSPPPSAPPPPPVFTTPPSTPPPVAPVAPPVATAAPPSAAEAGARDRDLYDSFYPRDYGLSQQEVHDFSLLGDLRGGDTVDSVTERVLLDSKPADAAEADAIRADVQAALTSLEQQGYITISQGPRSNGQIMITQHGRTEGQARVEKLEYALVCHYVRHTGAVDREALQLENGLDDEAADRLIARMEREGVITLQADGTYTVHQLPPRHGPDTVDKLQFAAVAARVLHNVGEPGLDVNGVVDVGVLAQELHMSPGDIVAILDRLVQYGDLESTAPGHYQVALLNT